MRSIFQLFIIVAALSVLSFIPPRSIEKISLNLLAKTLYNGKYITMKGDVYYKVSGGQLVTRITYPREEIVITNANGEIKIYDPVSNTVHLSQGLNYSSEYSFIYQFLSGKSHDMGLSAAGFKLKETRVEKDFVVTQWLPPISKAGTTGMVELVLKEYTPVFMCFYDTQGNPLQKIYYSNYHKAEDVTIPLNITEIQFMNGDSSITKRTYSDLKINENVENSYLNFTIPSNATIKK